MINTLFLGKVLKHFPELESTSNYAKDLLSKSKPVEGLVVLADNQTAGRGQYGSTWQNDPAKALLLSVILYPKFLKVHQQFQLSKAVALGLSAFCEACTSDKYAIKWPNDIYKNDKKCAGILIENNLQGNHIESSIVGIGINLFPLSNYTQLTQATGIFNEGVELEKMQLVANLLGHLEHYYLKLKQGKTSQIDEAYLQKLYRKDCWSMFELPDGTPIAGNIAGTDENGRLLLQTKDKLLTFSTKEIKMIL